MDVTKPVILLAGPTASGKTELAIRLAEQHDGVVINADSMQVYEEMRILTARPTKSEEARCPHRLFGIISVAEEFSVGRWLELAVAEIIAAHDRDQLPIVAGGTGMYLSALLEGIAAIPDVDEAVRQEVRALMIELGAEKFHDLLRREDPEMADRLRPSDRQRQQRALEVIRGTGRSLAYWMEQPTSWQGLQGPVFPIALLPDRQWLYERCNRRLDLMVEAGALDEVARLREAGFDPTLSAMKALGVPDFFAHLEGRISLEEALEKAKTGTRRYAKRQFTWINNKMISWNRYSAQQMESIFPKIFSDVSEFLLTRGS